MAANPTCNLADLDATVDQTVYTKEKAVFLIDETGQAFQFLRYRARIHSAMKPGDLDPEKLRKGGEDAFFYDDSLSAFGVADGVGGSASDTIDPVPIPFPNYEVIAET